MLLGLSCRGIRLCLTTLGVLPFMLAACGGSSESSEAGTDPVVASGTTVAPVWTVPPASPSTQSSGAVPVLNDSSPGISGTPNTTAIVGRPYAFTPSVSDPSGRLLSFAVAHRPSWLVFNTSTGELSGTPITADVGTHSNIAVSVSDGLASATLPGFSISVSPNAAGAGTVTIKWATPSENDDGTQLTDLWGYHVYYGTDPDNLEICFVVAGPDQNEFITPSLSPGRWYFAVTGVNVNDVEGDHSDILSLSI
jgi:hypothetical protein